MITSKIKKHIKILLLKLLMRLENAMINNICYQYSLGLINDVDFVLRIDERAIEYNKYKKQIDALKKESHGNKCEKS